MGAVLGAVFRMGDKLLGLTIQVGRASGVEAQAANSTGMMTVAMCILQLIT
jgi:hypothetical protein